MTGDLTTRQYLELQDDEMDVWLELSPQGNQTRYSMDYIDSEFQMDFYHLSYFLST